MRVTRRRAFADHQLVVVAVTESPGSTDVAVPRPSLGRMDELATVFAQMSGLLMSAETADCAVRLVTSLAAETLPGAVGAGVSRAGDSGGRETRAASDPLVERADEVQYALGEGPCLAAWASRVLVAVDDVAVDDRWPRWASAVGALGVRAAMSAPLVAGDRALGVLKVYADRPAVFDRDAARRLTMFAAQAAVLVANARPVDVALHCSEALVDALRSRDVISTAKGVVMAREGIGEDAAMGVLTAQAQRGGRTLRETALSVVRSAARARR
jgi:GAF domain-containing protein